MFAELTREAFVSLNDEALVWACVEPVIREIRGKNLSIKTQAAGHLNEAQRALLMVQVVYGHSQGGIDELFASLSYLVSAKGVWEEIAKGFRFFAGEEAGRFVDILKDVYALPDQSAVDEDGKLSAELHRHLERTIVTAAAYIRGNPDMFVKFRVD